MSHAFTTVGDPTRLNLALSRCCPALHERWGHARAPPVQKPMDLVEFTNWKASTQRHAHGRVWRFPRQPRSITWLVIVGAISEPVGRAWLAHPRLHDRRSTPPQRFHKRIIEAVRFHLACHLAFWRIQRPHTAVISLHRKMEHQVLHGRWEGFEIIRSISLWTWVRHTLRLGPSSHCGVQARSVYLEIVASSQQDQRERHKQCRNPCAVGHLMRMPCFVSMSAANLQVCRREVW